LGVADMSEIPAAGLDQNGEVGEGALHLEGPFWKFALDFYSIDGVAAALIALQDDADVDVIQALLTIYTHKTRGHALSADDLAAARSALDRWRQAAVLPLRNIRRHLRTIAPRLEAERLRQEVKKAELHAEQIHIAMAERWLKGRQTSPGLPLKEGISMLVDQYSGSKQSCDQSLTAAIDKIVDAASVRVSDEGIAIEGRRADPAR